MFRQRGRRSAVATLARTALGRATCRNGKRARVRKKEPQSTHREPGLGCIFSFMNWDKLREWVQTLGLVAIPIVVAVIGNAVAKSNATRETNAEYVKMAVDVLAHDSTHA